uniref:CUB domain-containing protein n=1 Tax=Brugia timori TaxID=42155 RepID=A0A0R3RCP9_9BILA
LLLSAVSSSGKKLQIKTQLMQSKVNIDTPYIQPRTIYTHSTDSLGGFPCYMYGSTTQYLNQPYVRDALHIPNYIPSYQLCNLNITYDSLYNDTTLLFQQLLNSNYSLNVLLYNGDLDTACNFLQGEWFMENFANSNAMVSFSMVVFNNTKVTILPNF